MNVPQIATVAALADRALGWAVEQFGRAVAAPAMASMGRNRQLRATVTLRCVEAKTQANKLMRSWKLLDRRLLHVADAR